MSQIKTESITGLNNISDANIDLSDDGTTTFNGPIVADRVKAGSSNLQYIYKSRTAATSIPIPNWATDIEIDFYAFQATTAATYYTTITPLLANSTVGQTTSDFRLHYANISTNLGYGAIAEAGGNWGSNAGTSSSQTIYLFTNSASVQWAYTGTIRFKRLPFINTTSNTNIIYYMTANCIYTGGGQTGVLNYNGYMYGAGDDSNDVISAIGFDTNGANDTHVGSFYAKFREEDQGTLITT
jgi:hypothetical protein